MKNFSNNFVMHGERLSMRALCFLLLSPCSSHVGKQRLSRDRELEDTNTFAIEASNSDLCTICSGSAALTPTDYTYMTAASGNRLHCLATSSH
jgi:hypothetical protein